MGAVAFRDRFELGRSNHREFRLMGRQFLRRHADKQLLHEKSVPGILSDDLNRKLILLVRTGIQVQNIQVALPHMRDHPREKSLELHWVEGLVHLAPVDTVSGHCVLHREFVAWGTSRARAGQRHQGAIVCQARFTPGNGRFHQLGSGEVPVDVGPFHQLSCHRSCLD